MVVANVAIQICKEDTTLCGNNDKVCRFLDDTEGTCVLFSKGLKVTKPDDNGDMFFRRCKPCMEAEPG
jgi:hypothetical protein